MRGPAISPARPADRRAFPADPTSPSQAVPCARQAGWAVLAALVVREVPAGRAVRAALAVQEVSVGQATRAGLVVRAARADRAVRAALVAQEVSVGQVARAGLAVREVSAGRVVLVAQEPRPDRRSGPLAEARASAVRNVRVHSAI